jgi:HTH-type transcriptional regulator / antitoxin HipB
MSASSALGERRLRELTPLRDKRLLPCKRVNPALSCLEDMNDYPVKTPKQLGSVLQGYRRERGLTQTDVGTKVGLAQKAVSKIELAPERAGLNMIFKLLAALDLELVVRPRGTPAGRSEW